MSASRLQTRSQTASARHQNEALAWRVLSLPLRAAALSWGLSVLPLTVLLRLGSRVARVVDSALAVCGLTWATQATRAKLASEEALRQQLRQSASRLRATQEQLARCEAALQAAQHELAFERERARPVPAPLGVESGADCAAVEVGASLLRLLYVSCALCAAACVSLAETPHLAIERKLVTVALVPTSLTFVLQGVGTRTQLASLLTLCANCFLAGFVAHLLLRRSAGAPAGGLPVCVAAPV